MGLMDKVKAQASTLAQSANAGMAKLDSMPAQRRADSMLRSLGLAVLAERTGRGTSETPAHISQILADIAQHESQNNVDLVQQAAQAQAQQAQQQQQQMQRPGEYLSGTGPMDPSVPGPMPGAPGPGPGYGGGPAPFQQPGPAGGFGPAPTSFPQPGGPTSFPEPGGPSGFPEPSAPSGFPQSGGSTGFPEAIPVTSFPPASPVSPGTEEPESEQGQSGFPGSAFPPSAGV